MTTLTHTPQRLHARTALPGRVELAPAPAAGRVNRHGPAFLATGDAAAALAAVLVTGAPLWALLLVPAALLALSLRGDYKRRAASLLDSIAGALAGVSVAAGSLLLAAATLAPSQLPAGAIAHAWLVAAALLAAHRAAVHGARRGRPGTPTVVVGSHDDVLAMQHVLRTRPDAGLLPVATMAVDLSAPFTVDEARSLARLVRDSGGHEVVIAAASATDGAVGGLARACAEEGLGVAVRTAVADAGAAIVVEHVGPVPLLRLAAVDRGDWRLAVKHGADRLVAAFALLAIAPVFGTIALAVRLASPGPVLFRQRRVGRDGREFDMLKFRSMRTAAAGAGTVPVAGVDLAPGGVEGDDRRTAIGALLRRTSLDELPQLLNVLRGDMSLVGPRPERPEFVGRFVKDVDRYGERHRLKSGMTGLAQVNGLRGKTSIADRVAYDNHYVEHWSLWLDVKILLRTVRAVLEPAE